jgi:predicted LPLAT superfamily acyltransferase
MKHWTEKSERGSAWLIHVVVWLARRAGRLVCRGLLYPIVFYFLLTDSMARRSSAEFLETVHGRKAHWRDVFSHIYSFAATLLDRVYMAAGDFDNFEVTVEGLALVDRALRAKKGCVLLGSHLGSFDLMMLAGGAMDGHMVNVMMRVDPRSRVRRIAGVDDGAFNLIPLGRPDSYLRAHEALSSGGIVAVLADRVDGAANLPVRFMDRMTSMPIAPHILAARSGAPILMFFGLYENRNRYRIEFVECGQAAAFNSRGDELQPVVNAYASVLEQYARRYPLNWFNFYPYWNADGDGT